MDKKIFTTRTPSETMDFAVKVAKLLDRGSFISLIGNLGSGKTVFVKGLAKGLNVEKHEYVNSPSFVVLKEYKGEMDLYHFDVYRLEQRSFCETLDYEKYFYGKGVAVVEWADKIRDIIPEEYLEIVIEYGSGENERILSVNAVGEKYKTLVGEI